MSRIETHPLTPDRWADFETVMGPNGAYAGCWCMFWRTGQKAFRESKGEGNRKAMRAIVKKGPPPGLLVYVGGEPAGWAQVCPRDDLPTLDRSRLAARVDDAPVFSISCFYVRREFRGKGLSAALVAAAKRYAAHRGATLLEAYPWKSATKKAPVTVYTGVASTFERAGFETVAARAPHRPVMRARLKGGR